MRARTAATTGPPRRIPPLNQVSNSLAYQLEFGDSISCGLWGVPSIEHTSPTRTLHCGFPGLYLQLEDVLTSQFSFISHLSGHTSRCHCDNCSASNSDFNLPPQSQGLPVPQGAGRPHRRISFNRPHAHPPSETISTTSPLQNPLLTVALISHHANPRGEVILWAPPTAPDHASALTLHKCARCSADNMTTPIPLRILECTFSRPCVGTRQAPPSPTPVLKNPNSRAKSPRALPFRML